MSQNTSQSGASPRGTRYAILALAVVFVFAVSYGIASARSGSTSSALAAGTASSGVIAGNAAAGSSGGSSPACACCGGSAAQSEPIEGTARLEGGVQRIDVDLSSGSYNPNTIILKAGVPAEVTFGQSSGCTAQVISQDLGFSEDLTSGPKTVKLGALSAGEYAFSCGMQMVFGKIVVQ